MFNPETYNLHIDFRKGGVIGTLKDHVVICHQTAYCIAFDGKNGTNEMETLNPTLLKNPDMVRINDTTLWLVGGWVVRKQFNTTQFITANEIKKGPELPFTIHSHCMVEFNSSTTLVIGGTQNGVRSSKTWFVNHEQGFRITEGPPLLKKRSKFSCARMMDRNGNHIIIVAIGSRQPDDTVEILKPSKNNWENGTY